MEVQLCFVHLLLGGEFVPGDMELSEVGRKGRTWCLWEVWVLPEKRKAAAGKAGDSQSGSHYLLQGGSALPGL